jgi:hypothetical protein
LEACFAAKRYLKEALKFVADVQVIFHSSGDGGTASRLKIVGDAIRNEIEHLDRLLGRQIVLPARRLVFGRWR